MNKALLVSLAAVVSIGSANAYSLFDFEEFNATNTTGALNSLTSTKNGLTLTINRSSGENFDVTDTSIYGSNFPFPQTWGTRCLDPFWDYTVDDYFVGNFSTGVSAVEMEMTDFGQDSDVVEMDVWSGANGTGTLLAVVTNDWGLNTSPSYAAVGWNNMGSGQTAMSVTFRGGDSPDGYYNSMFVDNIAATAAVPEPASMMALGLGAVALLRKRKK